MIDYKPRRLDVAALRAGNLGEVLNITAWSDVLVQLPSVRLTGVQGWDELGSLLTQQYIGNITSSQVFAPATPLHNQATTMTPDRDLERVFQMHLGELCELSCHNVRISCSP